MRDEDPQSRLQHFTEPSEDSLDEELTWQVSGFSSLKASNLNNFW